MDRSTEVVNEYAKISRQTNREVEGDWYLIEKNGCDDYPIVEQLIDGYIAGPDNGIEVEWYERNDYTLTPVSIFRKE